MLSEHDPSARAHMTHMEPFCLDCGAALDLRGHCRNCMEHGAPGDERLLNRSTTIALAIVSVVTILLLILY